MFRTMKVYRQVVSCRTQASCYNVTSKFTWHCDDSSVYTFYVQNGVNTKQWKKPYG